MKPRVIFIHGNQTTHWSLAWGGWLQKEVSKLGYATFFETMPDSIMARSKYWLPFLENHVKVGENDVLVGYSSGAVAAMRYAEDHRIFGSILIAPCYTDTGDELERQSGYYDQPWKWTKIKENQQSITLLYSEDDPYIALSEFEHIQKHLEPKTVRFKDKRHFIEMDEFPELLQEIQKLAERK